MMAVLFAEAVLVACNCVTSTPVRGAAPSLLPEGAKLALAWHDEFDGDRLDEAKWSYRTNFWGRPASWFARPEDGCVEVMDGTCRMRPKKLADGRVVSPQLQTGELVWDRLRDGKTGFWPYAKMDRPKFAQCYGYFECRCRLQRERGWWSAFWMQSETQGACLDPARAGIEHDIMECFNPGHPKQHHFHYNGYGVDHVVFKAEREHGDDPEWYYSVDPDLFHTFGLLWEPDGYTVFIDGKQAGYKVGTDASYSEAVSHVPEFILLTTEVNGGRDSRKTGKDYSKDPAVVSLVEKSDLFEVDFVRVYSLVGERADCRKMQKERLP